MKAIVGHSAHEIAPRLLGFLSLARQSGLRADVLRGPAGELCVVPHESDLGGVLETGPRHWVEAQVQDEQVTWGDASFHVHERRVAQGALEIATAVTMPAAPRPQWRQRVLLALRDEAVLGRVVRALLERGRDTMSLARVAPGHVHPETSFLLLVRDAPLYVVLEILEEGFGHVFYEACHAQQPDKLLGLFLPWGFEFPLVAALGARLDQPCVRQTAGRLAALDLEALVAVDAVLAPELAATTLPLAHLPAGDVRIRVPLRLVALDKAQTAEPAELWRVGPDMMEHLAADLTCAEDRLAGALAQVVRLGDDEKPSVFIWIPTPNGEDEERLAFTDMPGFARARRRLPNLLLPTRHAILPTLADETLRSVFELRQGVLSVVDAAPDRTLVRYRLRVEDFRPLRATLVEYSVRAHEPTLLRLCETASFAFEPVIIDQPGAPEPEAPADTSAQTPNPPQAPQQPQQSETEDRSADGVAAQSWTGSTPGESAPAQVVPWPTRLEQATRHLIDSPADERHLADFFQASLALGRRVDAGFALLRLLPSCAPARARNLLTACLGLAGREGEREALAALTRSEPPTLTLAQELELVLGATLASLSPPDELSTDLRRGIARLPSRVLGLAVPRLTWTAALAASRLLRDPAVLSEAQLALEQALASIGVRSSVPPLVAETLESQNGAANTGAIRAFADSAGLAPSERLFLRLAYAMRLLVLGGGVDLVLQDELAKELEALRPSLGDNVEKVQSLLRTLDHVRTHDTPTLDTSTLDPNLRTVLIEEGYLPPLNESTETGLARQGAALALLSAADASEQVVRLFQEIAGHAFRGLDVLPGVASRLRSADQQEALLALRARVAAARGNDDSANRNMVALTGLRIGLDCALDPKHDPMTELAGLVSEAARLSGWDLPLGARAVLAALEPLPIHARRLHAVSLYRLLRQHDVIRAWSGQRTVRVDELRVLLRLVNLLVVPVDELPEGERLCRAEWSGMRERMRQDLAAAPQS